MTFELTQENYSQAEVKTLLEKYVQSQTQSLQTQIEGLTPKDKTESEIALEKRISELDKKERLFAIKEQGLPSELADYLNSDADIGKIVELFKANNSYTPNNSKKSTAQAITREQFNNMSYNDRAKIYNENPELVKNLM